MLIPRFTRFIYEGTVYNCTVKNLARTFISVFADIKELMQYKSHAFLNGEIPKMGWGIVPLETPSDTLGKNYMEQTQYLRLIATTVGVPSHMVRRRTLVEAIYDIIVGQLALPPRRARPLIGPPPVPAKRISFASASPDKVCGYATSIAPSAIRPWAYAPIGKGFILVSVKPFTLA